MERTGGKKFPNSKLSMNFKTFKTVTPVIQQMIEGKQVITPEAVYRLKGKSKFSEVYV